MERRRFQLDLAPNSEFRFRLLANNSEPILASEGYSSKQACSNGIVSVKKNALDETKFEKLERGSNYYFNLKAGNGEVIGISEMYTSASARDNGIKSVMTNAPIAEVEDLTVA
ncbi:MAG: YegP family protein [Bacteroidota bacterium]|nr:YegP family protein [Bacteroidota bacterium]